MAGFLHKSNRNKFTCPFCFKEYDKSDIPYVCPACGEKTISATVAKKGKPTIKCKNCGGTATLRLCPLCGEYDRAFPAEGDGVIPAGVLTADASLTLGIIGECNSGKTSFITVMLHELSRASELKVALCAQNMYTQDVYYDLCKTIYEEHMVPCATYPVKFGDGLQPQLWEIKNLMRQRGKATPSYAFTICDAPGESIGQLNSASVIQGYMNALNAVIITIDSLCITSLQGMVNPDIRRNSRAFMGETDSAEGIVNRLAACIRAARGIGGAKMVTVPVAVVLTKFDHILQLDSLPADAVVRKPSTVSSNGKVNLNEIFQVDKEIRSWLYGIGEGTFVSVLECNFKNFCLFGVSSYGEPPTAMGIINEYIHPHRILDPVFWIFKEADFID